MRHKPLDYINNSNRRHYQAFLEQWPWEWLITLRVPNGDHNRAMKIIHNKLLRTQKGQVASMGVYVDGKGLNGRHLHAFMLGRFKGGQTLRDMNASLYISDYGMASKTGGAGAVIEPISNLHGAVAYVLSPCNTPSAKHELLYPWGRILDNTKHVLKEVA